LSEAKLDLVGAVHGCALCTPNTASIQDDAVTVAKIAQGTNGQVLATVSSNTAWTSLDASYISNFDTQVRTNRLDQMTAPTASVSMNSNKITSLATPTASADAATKGYVDGLVYASSHTATCSGSATSVTFSATTTFTVGQFTIQVPIDQGGASRYLTCSGCMTSGVSSNPSQPILVFIPDSDANVGSEFNVYFTRSGAGNNTVAFTVSRGASHNVGTALNLVNGSTAVISFVKGSS